MFYKSARELVDAIMIESHKLLKITKANYFQFIKIKTGYSIEELGKGKIHENKFQEFFKRLVQVNPENLARYLDIKL